VNEQNAKVLICVACIFWMIKPSYFGFAGIDRNGSPSKCYYEVFTAGI
jgi:hypothetical protein